MLAYISALALSLASAAPAAPALTPSGSFVAISVADLDSSIAWYRKTFGLRPVAPPARVGDMSIAVLEGAGLTIELVKDGKAIERSAASHGVRGYFKFGVVVPDFDQLPGRLEAQGIVIAMGPFPARPAQRANLLIRDPDGNYIQLLGGYSASPSP